MNTRETIVKDRSYLTTSSLCQRDTCRRQQQQQQHCVKSLCLLLSTFISTAVHFLPIPFVSLYVSANQPSSTCSEVTGIVCSPVNDVKSNVECS